VLGWIEVVSGNGKEGDQMIKEWGLGADFGAQINHGIFFYRIAHQPEVTQYYHDLLLSGLK